MISKEKSYTHKVFLHIDCLILTTSESSSHQPWPLVSLSAASLLQGQEGWAYCKEGDQTAPPVSTNQTPKPQLYWRHNGPHWLLCWLKQESFARDLWHPYWHLYWKNLFVWYQLVAQLDHRSPQRCSWCVPGLSGCVSWVAAGGHRAGG